MGAAAAALRAFSASMLSSAAINLSAIELCFSVSPSSSTMLSSPRSASFEVVAASFPAYEESTCSKLGSLRSKALRFGITILSDDPLKCLMAK